MKSDGGEVGSLDLQRRLLDIDALEGNLQSWIGRVGEQHHLALGVFAHDVERLARVFQRKSFDVEQTVVVGIIEHCRPYLVRFPLLNT